MRVCMYMGVLAPKIPPTYNLFLSSAITALHQASSVNYIASHRIASGVDAPAQGAWKTLGIPDACP